MYPSVNHLFTPFGLAAGYKICLKSPCTASTALLALIEVQGLLRQILRPTTSYHHFVNDQISLS